MADPADPKTYSFDLLFLKRFWALHKILFPGVWSVNSGLLVLLVVLCGMEQYLVYEVGLIPGQFFKVLGDKDLAKFWTATARSVGIIVCMAMTKSARVYSTRLLTVGWRQVVCQALHRLYFSGINYYWLVVVDQRLDNPDQRITADVNSLVTNYGNIVTNLVVLPFTVAFYAYQAYVRAGWIGPTGMFAFFIVSTILNKFLMGAIVNITVEMEKREGDFRFKHMQVRTNSESLAFHGSPSLETNKVNKKLMDLCQTQQSLYNRNFLLNIAINMFDYLSAIASYLIISVPIFTGQYADRDPADLSQIISENSFVCMYLGYQLSQFVDISGKVAVLAGVTHRVAELVETLVLFQHKNDVEKDEENSNSDLTDISVDVEVKEDSEQFDQFNSTEDEINDKIFELKRVTISAPNSENVLVKDLELTIKMGENLMIMGPSSSGKSSLLRVLRGLWQPVRGEVVRHKAMSHNGVFFLPQRAFFTDGTLREQVTYPMTPSQSCSEDARLDPLFELTALTDLVQRCGGLDMEPSGTWYDMLSPGEQQRLAFIRLLYHLPSVAVLDEATSALSVELEAELYKAAMEAGVTLVSVGHRTTLKQFHSKLLLLGREGWSLQEI